MKKAIGILWLVALAAVGVAIFGHSVSQLAPAQPKQMPTTEAEVYAQLWSECAARGLSYEVYCFEGIGCNAEAFTDGYHDSYLGHAVGPTEAVQDLLLAMKGKPNAPAKDGYKEGFRTGIVQPY